MISIIIPIYNGSNFIISNYISIINQTYRDYELIYVNDGSTDDSIKILNELKNSDSRISIINQKNGGVSSARNAGLSLAKGEFICFIDVDDTIDENYLLHLFNNLQQNCCDLSLCSTISDAVQKSTNEGKKIIYDNDTLLVKLVEGKVKVGVWNGLFRKNIIDENYLKFKEGYKYSEDLHFIYRYIVFSRSIVLTSEKLYIYNNDNTQSAMAKFNIKDRMDSIYLFEDIGATVEQFGSSKIKKYYRKYAVNKAWWSLAWQGANKLNKEEYIKFCRLNQIRQKFLKLITIRNIKISLSSLIGLISLNLFRYISIKFGRSVVHK